MQYLSQILFLITTAIGTWFFVRSVAKIRRNILLGKPADRTDNPGARLRTMTMVALGQSKMVVRPVAGFFHILIYVGFVLINIEVLEIIIDGLFGTHRIFMEPLGALYTVAIGFFEILALLVIVACVAFLIRRNIIGVRRFKGVEMTRKPVFDANAILIIETVLMLALLLMNAADAELQQSGALPVSRWMAPLFPGGSHLAIEISWWFHWIGILLFLNYIPYSKHLHIFMAFPNTYYADLEPNGKFDNMQSVTTEVNLMMDPSATPPEGYEPPTGFGVRDITDLRWKNLMDAYTCTECGRCTSVCPANITGKLLSPRKIMMDTRDRIEEVSQNIDANGSFQDDGKNLHSYISAEELWACTTCNACVDACPVMINPMEIIYEMRQYKVMEESSAPAELNNMFSNIENNGAPWQFSPLDRGNWANN